MRMGVTRVGGPQNLGGGGGAVLGGHLLGAQGYTGQPLRWGVGVGVRAPQGAPAPPYHPHPG